MINQEIRIKYIKACANNEIVKSANIGGEIADVLVNSIKGLIDPNNIVASILQLGLEGIIAAKFGFLWGIVASVLDKVFGINVKNLLKLITGNVGNFIKANPDISQLSPGTIDSISSQITNATLSTAGIDNKDANVPIQQLTDKLNETNASINFGIVKDAQLASKLASLSIGGIVKAIIAALLRGAAASASVVAVQQSDNKIAPKDSVISPSKTDRINNKILSMVGKPSGKGEVYHKNDASKESDEGDNAWFITSSGNFSKTLYNWIVGIYPNMPENIENKVYDNFAKITQPLRKLFIEYNQDINIDSSGEYIRVPKEFKTQKQIVDTILANIT